MVRSRRMLVSLLLAGIMLVSASIAAAAPAGNGKGNGKAGQNKARLTWSEARVERTLAPGEATTVTVDLVSTANLENVQLWVPGGLGRMTSVNPSGPFNLTAGQAMRVTLTLTQASGATESQGGVVKVIAGRRNVPQSLKVLVRVPGDTSDQSGDARKPEKSKDNKGNNGQGQGNGKAKDKKASAATRK